MRFLSLIIFLLTMVQSSFAQIKNKYSISFDNAEHHEARVVARFSSLQSGPVSLRMSRTSPGAYALQEFSKNVYNVKITDSKGKEVKVTRPNLHQWDVTGHDGTVLVYYNVFGDRGDGTYNQIDETHAIINAPATFMYIPSLKDRPVEVNYLSRVDLGWKLATQLKLESGTTYSAPNLQLFMDSPVMLSGHVIKKQEVGSGASAFTLQMALQHQGTDQDAIVFFEKIKKIVEEERKVFGDYPVFDNGNYTFLACFMPQVSNDGVEHRNSSVITNSKGLADGDEVANIGTFAREFFQAWNLERIRPLSLEPFDFEKANISDDLWFAEGITDYYTQLFLCRTGVITEDAYIQSLSEVYNKVWNSPALQYYNPKDMSRRAPFIDDSKFVDRVNTKNTYISYSDYGNALGLALDLSLRNEKNDLNLDGFMTLFWTKYGKSEIPYTSDNLFITLREYAGPSFADNFFSKYINGSEVPDFKKILAGVALYLKSDGADIGADYQQQNIW